MFFPYRMIKAVNGLFEKWTKHQRINKHGEYSTIRTAIRGGANKAGAIFEG